MSNFYPICLKLENEKCLVVGGGKVAARKIESLVAYRAKVYVISPEVEDIIRDWALAEKIQWFSRDFEENDLEGAFLVISATNNEKFNSYMAELCRQKQILVNVVDDPAKCSFIVPAVMRRGSLTVSIATDGKSPLLARRLRERLEGLLGDEYDLFLQIMGEVRERARRDISNITERQEVYTSIVDSDIIDLLRDGHLKLVKERIESVFAGRRIKP